MFDGSARERSGVSLSMRRNGKKDTKTILEQSRIQREVRAAERLKQQSASTIQRYFRGYTCRKSIFLQLRIDFDKQLSDVNKVRAVYDRLKKNATDEFNIPWNNMKILLRSVSFLITHSSAVESITDVMGLQTGSNRISESLNIIGNAVSYLMRNKNVDSVVWRYVSVVLEHGISSTSTSMAKGFVNSKTAGTICKALSLIGQELLLGNHPTVLLDLAHTNYLTICELLQQALQYKIHQMALLHCMAKESEDFMELVDEDESCVHKKARSSIVDANANEYDNSGDNSINVIIEELCTFITTYISVYESQQHLNTKTNSRSNERMSVILYGLIHHVVSIPNISKIFVDMSTHYTVETVACLNALKGLCGICSRKSASNVVCRNTLYAYCDARYMLNESSTDCDKVTKVLHVLCNMLLMSSPKSETDVISPLCVADLGYSENSHFWSLLYKVVCGSMTARVPIFSLITKKMSTAHEPRTGRLGYGAHALTKYDSPHSDGIALLEVLIDVQQEAVVSSQNSSNLLGGGLFQKPFKLPSHNKSWEERALDEYDTVSHVLYSLFGDSSNVDEIVTQAVDGILKAKSMKTDPTVSDLSTSQGSSIIVDTLLEQYHTILCIYTCILIPMLKMPAPKGGTSSSEVNSARAPELFVLGNQMLNRLSFSSRNDCTLLKKLLEVTTIHHPNQSLPSVASQSEQHIQLLFYTLLSNYLKLSVDEDVLVSYRSLSLQDIVDVISSLREKLYAWYWSDAEGTVGLSTSNDNGSVRAPIGFPQRVAIGLVDKKSSACYDPGKNMYSSCGVEMLHTFMSAVDTIESLSVSTSEQQQGPLDLDRPHMVLLQDYYCIYVVMKVFNQLYGLCSRRAVVKSINTASDSGLESNLEALLTSEELWLWRNTYSRSQSTSKIFVNSTLVPPPSLVSKASNAQYALDFRLEGTINQSQGESLDEMEVEASTNDYAPTVSHDTLQYSIGYSPISSSSSLPDDPFNEQFYNAGGTTRNLVKVTHGAAALLKAVLIMVPQVIPFQVRVAIFECLLAADKATVADNEFSIENYTRSAHPIYGGLDLEIRRSHIVEDSYNSLKDTLPNNSHAIVQADTMKKRMRIAFISEQGHVERGIDGGGLFKEFIDTFLKNVFDPKVGYFLSTPEHWLIPNPQCKMGPSYFVLIGKMLGKAVYERMLVDSQLSITVLRGLLKQSNQYDDMIFFDKQLYRSLNSLRMFAVNKDRDTIIESLGLTFEVVGSNGLNVELVPGGREVAVTALNIYEYIAKYANYRLNVECKTQMDALLLGFRSMIHANWIRMFSAHELQKLIGGEKRPLDLQNMQKYCKYSGGYHPSQLYIQAFWKIVAEMSVEDQGNLLMFVTSCSRQPLLGFGQLDPPFCIQRISTHEVGSVDEENRRLLSAQSGGSAVYGPYVNPAKLPSAGTCMNLLKLPEYYSIDMLKEKLLYAIRSNSGFELT